MTDREKDELWLAELLAKNGYSHGHLTDDGRYICLSEFLFTIGIIEGQVGNDYGYDRRWCYEPILALPALDEWAKRGFEGSPVGWKRAI